MLTTVNPSLDNLAQSLTLGDTMVFGNNMVNSLRFAFNRTAVNRDNDPYFDPADLGIKVYSYVPDSMIVVVTGGFSIAAATATRGIADNNTYQVSDDLTLVRGNHQIALGGKRRVLQGLVQDVGARRRTVELQRPGDGTGAGGLSPRARRHARAIRALRRCLLPVVPGHCTPRTRGARASRVTVNAGLRWEPFFGQNLTRGAITNFDRDRSGRTSRARCSSTRRPASSTRATRASRRHVGAEQAVVELLAARRRGVGRARRRPHWRSGRRTRSMYDYPGGEYFNNLAAAPPYGNRTLVSDPAGLFDDPYRDVGGNPHPIETSPEHDVPHGRDVLVDRPGHQFAARPVVERHVEQQLGADWGRRSAISAATRTACGVWSR